MTPAWLLDVAAALMLVVAAVSAARLAAARPWRRGAAVIDTDAAHLLMAIAMAGMLTPALRTLPDIPWEVAFKLLAAWFAVRVAQDASANGVRALAGGHCVPHLVHGCSMLYMFLAMTVPAAAAGGMSDMGGTPGGAGAAAIDLRYPTLALLFAFILIGYSIWDLDQLSGRRYSLATPRPSIPGIAASAAAVPGLPMLAGAEAGSLTLPAPLALPSPVAPHGFETLPGSETAPHGLAPLPDPNPGVADQEPSRQPSAANGEAAGRAGGDAADRDSSFLLSPAVTIGCRIAMGVAMAFMLFIAI